MIKPQHSAEQISQALYRELREIYSLRESESLLRIIFDHVGVNMTKILSQPGHVPDPAVALQIKEIVSEIHTGRPIQYILGYTEFFDLVIEVDEQVLIPRPETEEMVARMRDTLPGIPRKILDIGTGSGCIALALKKQYPRAEVTGMDSSEGALRVAERNGRKAGLRVQWEKGDILEDWQPPGNTGYDLIVSNPPYVMEKEKKGMMKNVLAFEPGEALFVPDRDPLLFYRAIARFSAMNLIPGGELWLEINEHLGQETRRTTEQGGFQQVSLLRDMQGKDRFIRATLTIDG